LEDAAAAAAAVVSAAAEAAFANLHSDANAA
jgi:hypothetical protein